MSNLTDRTPQDDMKVLAANKEYENRNSGGKSGTGGLLGYIERSTGKLLHAVALSRALWP